MGRAALVAIREYIENLRTKTFWIGIFIFPVILVLAITVPAMLSSKKDVRRYVVLDSSGFLLEAVEKKAAFPDLAKLFKEARRLDRNGDSLESFPEDISKLVRALRDVTNADFRAGLPKLVNVYDPGAMPTPFVNAIKDRYPEFDQNRSLVTDRIRTWYENLDPEEAKKLGSNLDRSRYRRIEPQDLGVDREDSLNRMVDEGEIFAWFAIGENPIAGPEGCKYISNNQTDDSLRRWFAGLANEVIREKRFNEKGIAKEVYREILTDLSFEARKVGEGGAEEAVGTADKARQWIPVFFAYMLWVAVFTVAQMLLTNTVEEKSNRLIEVLLSSVSPLQLMAGKIAGIAITGLTILISWVFWMFLGVKYGPSLIGRPLEFDLSVVVSDPVYIGSFLGYFLLGYLFYAAFLVGLGSVCSSLKEAQNLMQPVMIVLIVPMLAILPVAQDPNGALATALSWVPPFTPFIMMNRAAGPPPTIEYILTTVLLLVSIALALIAAAKVFRVGILMTGKRPSIREICRWLWRSPGSVPQRTDEKL